MKTAQALLGHSDLETTLTVYTHALPASQRRAVERVSEVMFSIVLELGETHRHVNPSNDKHTVLCLHNSDYIRGQGSVAGIDLTCFQRASNCHIAIPAQSRDKAIHPSAPALTTFGT